MNYKRPAVLAFLVFSLSAVPLRAQHGGGGHGGGGHGGGFSGHSMGHSFGSVGHSIGHAFGFHSGHGARGSSAIAHGRNDVLPTPGMPRVGPNRSHHPLVEFGFNRRGFFGFPLNSGFGFCGGFGGFPSWDFWGDDFDCFNRGFFFDPFFAGGFFPNSIYGEEFGDSGEAGDVSPAAAADEDIYADAIIQQNDPAPPVDKVPHHRRSPHEPDALLQLKDGSMYGLRDYWVEGDRLYYVTNYGGQNSVPLSQIDLPKTTQMNAERGEKFSLDTSSAENSANSVK